MRSLDWRKFLNKILYCFGCGRFGVPSKKGIPRGWKVLYQPHYDAPPGLHVCSEKCADKVREAMKDGPVTEPLKQGEPPSMSAAIMWAMMREAVGDRIGSVIGAIGLEPEQEEQVIEALTVELAPMMMPQSPDAPIAFVPTPILDVVGIRGDIERGPVPDGVLCETACSAGGGFGGHAGVQTLYDEEGMDQLVARGPVKGAQVIEFIPRSQKDGGDSD